MLAHRSQQQTARRSAAADEAEGAVIAVDGLTKSYGDRQVLDGVSLAVAPQEIFGILGANGVGKTTAVEIIQGLRSRDGGTVQVLGFDPARDRRQLRRRVGSQLQSSALPEHLRVGEALRLFARLAGDVVDWRALADEWDVSRLQRSAFGALSGGERQRLFIALALVNRPQVVFLDELTQGLDPGARHETWRLIRRVRDAGTTVVLVSHFMDEVEELCDRVAVVHDGRVVGCDTPAGLVEGVGRTVRTRFSGVPDIVAAGLGAVPGVEAVHRDGDVVEVVGEPATPVRVAAALASHDVEPGDFVVVRPSLEDVFVTLTQGRRS